MWLVCNTAAIRTMSTLFNFFQFLFVYYRLWNWKADESMHFAYTNYQTKMDGRFQCSYLFPLNLRKSCSHTNQTHPIPTKYIAKYFQFVFNQILLFCTIFETMKN